MVNKAKVKEYLKKLQQAEKLKGEILAIEGEFVAHVADTGEATICNLLKVTTSKNPPKLVSVTEGASVTAKMREDLATALADTDFVKTSTSLQVKNILDAKDTNKVVKKALKVCKLDVTQSEKMGFEKIVTPLKKGV